MNSDSWALCRLRDKAIRLEPKCFLAFNARGVAWKAKEQYDKAIADYDEAIRLEPSFIRQQSSVTVELAWKLPG